MSAPPYECLHVPVQAAKVRVFGIPVWLLIAAALVAAVKVYGPWLVLAPVLVLVLALAVVLVVVALQARPGQGGGSGRDAGRDGADQAPMVALSGTGPTQCMGCGRGAAVGVLVVSGYRIPVCGPCRTLAEALIAPGALQAPDRTRRLSLPSLRSPQDGSTRRLGDHR